MSWRQLSSSSTYPIIIVQTSLAKWQELQGGNGTNQDLMMLQSKLQTIRIERDPYNFPGKYGTIG